MIYLFPSPYGVTVIKSSTSGMNSTTRTVQFPSPYGVTVIKSLTWSEFKEEICSMFPSPYGVTVIKSGNNVSIIVEVPYSFRPLMG